jgi:hypothetical protein
MNSLRALILVAACCLFSAPAWAADAYDDLMLKEGIFVGCTSDDELALFVGNGVSEGVASVGCLIVPLSLLESELRYEGWKFLDFPDWAGDFKDWASENSSSVLIIEDSPFLPVRKYTFVLGGCPFVGYWPYPMDPHYLDEEMGSPFLKAGGVACMPQPALERDDPRVVVAEVK